MRGAKKFLSAAQRAEMWRLWKEGQTISDICRALGWYAGSLHLVLSKAGGIPPRERHRDARHLSLSDREEISRGLSSGASIRSIARQIGRDPSTVSREIKRNGGSARYRAAAADSRAWNFACRPKTCKMTRHRSLARQVASRLCLQWSPEQISHWLKRTFVNDNDMQISHEAIYQSLFVQARGVLKKELQAHLRTRAVMRRSRKSASAEEKRGHLSDMVSIRERPAEAEDRAVPGHWEGDLISGSHNSHIATLVERHSRFVMLVKVDSKSTESVVPALIKHVSKLPVELRKSLTWDRGKEMAQHKAFSIATDVQVYFCDPSSPWQRGSNENTNGLLRQYFPKGTELSQYSQSYLNSIAKRLNQRPRKTLGFETPADKLEACVALTG